MLLLLFEVFLGVFSVLVFLKVDSMVVYCQVFSKTSGYKNPTISEDTRYKPATAHRMTIQISAHNHMITPCLSAKPSRAGTALIHKPHIC